MKSALAIVSTPLHLIYLADSTGGERVVAQTHVRHILIKPSEILSDEQAQELAKSLRKRVACHHSGISFAERAAIIEPLAKQAALLNNSRWGLLMRTGRDKSHLAHQIERYADIYTSRVSNFAAHTPFRYFRSHRGTLAQHRLVRLPGSVGAAVT